MNPYSYRDRTLHCEGIPLEKIVQHVGTPVHVYSHQALVENANALMSAFAAYHPLVCYSLKANANLTLCRLLAEQGVGADVVSGGELYLALTAGFAPEKIVYAGVGKTEAEIEFALSQHILMFNIESEPEFELIERVARRLGIPAPLSIRINPNVEAGTHQYITTGTHGTKFGLAPSQARVMYERIQASAWLQPVGIHMHIGSQINRAKPYVQALERVYGLIENLGQAGVNLQYLDIGGGFGIAYHPGEEPLALDEVARQIRPFLPEHMQLVIEPGRRLVGPTGILVCRLLYDKKGPDKRFYIVDAGMNDLLRPTLYKAHHKIIPVHEAGTSQRLTVDVVGPVCESGDFLAQEASLPPLNQGDLLAVMDTGAYGFSMSSTYNGRPLLPEVLVNGKAWRVIRRRGTYEELSFGQDKTTKKDAAPVGGNLDTDAVFWKMEGTGNDFVVMDNRRNTLHNISRQAVRFCDRKRGIGADGLILIGLSREADFSMRIFNPDGSEAEMCGNGARCAARFAYLNRISPSECTFSTPAGIINARVGTRLVQISTTRPSTIQQVQSFVVDGASYHGYHVNTGVPHLVLFVPNVDEVAVETLGRVLRFHKLFQPQGTNVDFVQVNDEGIQVRTYERGVEGETLSCGTGSVASALVSALAYNLTSPITVITRGGKVSVQFQRDNTSFHTVVLEGEANIVYRGSINEQYKV